MTISVTNHLNFRGDARTALEFYQSVFVGDITIITYKDVQNPSEENQVMWGQVTAKNGFQVMAYDVPSGMPWDPGKNAYFVSVRGDSDQEITELWEKLAAGATVAQPLEPSGWSPLYGMLTDRFGITWVLDVVTSYERPE
jgi:PhnB protein